MASTFLSSDDASVPVASRKKCTELREREETSGGAANAEIVFQFSSLSKENKFFGWLSAAAEGGKASSLLRFPVIAVVLSMAVNNSGSV